MIAAAIGEMESKSEKRDYGGREVLLIEKNGRKR